VVADQLLLWREVDLVRGAGLHGGRRFWALRALPRGRRPVAAGLGVQVDVVASELLLGREADLVRGAGRV
jgi:hypothetical protein